MEQLIKADRWRVSQPLQKKQSMRHATAAFSSTVLWSI